MPSRKHIISVLLADDQPLALAGIRKMLERADDIQVVGEAPDGFKVQQMVAKFRPQVLLLDLKMPGPSPTELERWVRENCPETVTLVLTAHDRDVYLANMMDAGAAGYIDKDVQAEQLISAIQQAAHGGILFDEAQISRAKHWHEDTEKKWTSLTKRERQILCLVGEGMNNKHVGIKLSVSTKTVEKHLTNIYEKLGVTSRTEAVVWWGEKGRDFPT